MTDNEKAGNNNEMATGSKGGAPKGHLNALKNGSRVARLTLGELPAKLKQVRTNTRQYRRDLERLVLDEKGEVTLADAHAIDAAAGHEQHGGICRWLLLHRFSEMSTADVVKCSGAVANAKVQRNAIVRRLGLDPSEPDGNGGNGNWPPFIVARECEPPSPPTEPPQPPGEPSSPSDDATAGDDAEGDSGESGGRWGH